MKRMVSALILGFAMGAAASAASAQPMHGDPLQMLSHLGAQLDLNTSQQQQWANAIALSTSAHDAMRTSMEQGRTALETELGKAEPDFATLAAGADAARAQVATLHQQARDAWLALYATFTPAQKATARDAIKAGIARMEQRHAMHKQGSSPTQ